MKVQEMGLSCALLQWPRQKPQEEGREVEGRGLGWLARVIF